MADGASVTVGVRLREAREKRGATLREIAAATRISAMSLEALERNDVSRLPGGIFTRAFIRAYAAEVGLDPESTIRDFTAQLESQAASSAHAPSVEERLSAESHRRAVKMGLQLLLVGVPIAGAAVFFGMRGGTLDPSSASSPQASSAVLASPAGAGTLAAPAPGQATGLTMQIVPRGTSWVSVTVDGERSFSGVMGPGDQRQVTAQDEIVLMIGDAGAFTYTLNGLPGRPLGAPGEVVSTRITVGDFRDYVLR